MEFDEPHGNRWKSLIVTRGSFGPDDSAMNYVADLKFDHPIRIKVKSGKFNFYNSGLYKLTQCIVGLQLIGKSEVCYPFKKLWRSNKQRRHGVKLRKRT